MFLPKFSRFLGSRGHFGMFGKWFGKCLENQFLPEFSEFCTPQIFGGRRRIFSVIYNLYKVSLLLFLSPCNFPNAQNVQNYENQKVVLVLLFCFEYAEFQHFPRYFHTNKRFCVSLISNCEGVSLSVKFCVEIFFASEILALCGLIVRLRKNGRCFKKNSRYRQLTSIRASRRAWPRSIAVNKRCY